MHAVKSLPKLLQQEKTELCWSFWNSPPSSQIGNCDHSLGNHTATSRSKPRNYRALFPFPRLSKPVQSTFVPLPKTINKVLFQLAFPELWAQRRAPYNFRKKRWDQKQANWGRAGKEAGKDQIKEGTRNPKACPPKMWGTIWGKANACVQNKEAYYIQMDFKLSFSFLIIKMIHFSLDKTSTVYCIMALLLLYNG